ncbi:EscU/YscU/HrcU family type III secretion system export apparatus switch protein [Sphingomonas sp. BT-65]|uniref:EscU/YscU/HrcU family type III secretion system export apparatus switch protein n=1 Tax=Sphingomonas sp. BT-65 TaxID=2989821 RepID=UPI002235AE35|nr:EscU/YscU/HrcU family type III secretion system export apparatus switch protein [Sphingomonas sp. BT-65]MCW4460983.1 EscU/YscU/HrcU family type III secretion system export apparatus switch protein [Sphingomonas sp. BT-65]
MADKNQGGDKTEKPTRKRLRDARKKGDIAKSKDLSSAISMIAWLVLFVAGAGFVGMRIADFTELSLAHATGQPFEATLSTLGASAFGLVVLVAGLVLVPAAVAGLVAEFLQTGALITTEKMKPQLGNLDPVEGLKRMFNPDNLFELLKTLIKAALILAIIWVVLSGSIDEFAAILHAAAWSTGAGAGPKMAAAVLDLSRSLTLQLIGWTIAIFLFVAFADRAWVQHRYIKRLKMSRRDIRQEHKDNEGDPMLKQQRRQMHEEWANQNAIASAGSANVLLTNPTHLAIALDYDPQECPVPVIAAKGEGPLAAAMRAEAELQGVPIVRNVPLARTVFATAGPGEMIPEDHFDAIAEIILWAKRARSGETSLEREDAA